ncbi:MAG TPA: hypothetical protein VN794_10100 [Methylomirabilota bacterium]|nr:hypothetical protein [Methylomirabilota bacterium]
MQAEGPILESLIRRLTEIPEDFLAEPRIGNTGAVYVSAVAGDLARSLGATLEATDLALLEGADPRRDRNRLCVALLLCWVLADEWFQQHPPPGRGLVELLAQGAAELGAQVAARKFVTDPERREELARFSLARLGFRPAGETIAQAQDRLTSLSSAERARVLQASRAAEARARAIREALARKAAEESADKFTRE